MSLTKVEKFETCFFLGSQTGVKFEPISEKRTLDKFFSGEKNVRLISDLKINAHNFKVASSTESDEELQILWLILKQAVNYFPVDSPARLVKGCVQQDFQYGYQSWYAAVGLSDEMFFKLLSWKAVYGKGLEIWRETTLTNVTATPKNVSLNGEATTSRNPIWFDKLDPVVRDSPECKRIRQELPFEKDFTFEGDFTSYLWMSRPKEIKNEWDKESYNFSQFSQEIEEKENVGLKILKEKIHTDMWIVMDSGISIPCHKCFLAGSSPVIAAMFDERWNPTGSGEVSTNLLKLENVSEETAHAFLDYVYISDISKATESLPIAVELLELSNRYNVVLLEEKLLKHLYKKSRKSEEWVSTNIDSLFRAYLFLETSGICELLEILMAKILREKSSQILESKEYMELQRDDPAGSVKIKRSCETQRSLEIPRT